MAPENVPLTLDNLLVIDINDGGKLPPINPAWHEHFLEIEGCAGQLFLGDIKDRDKIPPEIIQKSKMPARPGYSQVNFLEGAEGYKRILEVYCGLLEQHFGDKDIANRMKRNWEACINPERCGHVTAQAREKRYGKLMNALITDGKQIRAQALEDIVGGNFIHPTSNNFTAVAAKNLLHLPPDADMLVIGDKEPITLGTLASLDGRHHHIVLTHPDAAQLEDLHHQVTGGRLSQTLRGEYDFVAYPDAMQNNLLDAPYVFNCRSMDNGTEDKALAEAWQRRPANNGTLVHLRGVPRERDATGQVWRGVKEPANRIVLPEDLRRQKQIDIEHNRQMEVLIRRAIANCTLSREHGVRPVYKYLLVPEQDYGRMVIGRVDEKRRMRRDESELSR